MKENTYLHSINVNTYVPTRYSKMTQNALCAGAYFRNLTSVLFVKNSNSLLLKSCKQL